MPNGYILTMVSLASPDAQAQHELEQYIDSIAALYDGDATLELCDRIVAELES